MTDIRTPDYVLSRKGQGYEVLDGGEPTPGMRNTIFEPSHMTDHDVMVMQETDGGNIRPIRFSPHAARLLGERLIAAAEVVEQRRADEEAHYAENAERPLVVDRSELGLVDYVDAPPAE